MSRAIGRDDVLWAYRLLLGREPESEDVLQHHLSGAASASQLVQAFLNSEEFRARSVSNVKPRDAGDGAALIESVPSAETVAALLQHVGREWARLGESEPHWSVLTSEQFRAQAIAGNLQAFRDSGVNEVRHIGSVLKRNGLAWPAQGVALEYGCGVGRVTLPLAQHCGQVVGVDISPGHLACAAAEARERGLSHKVRWLRLVGAADLEQLPAADLVYSRIVLQHNPPPVMELIVRHLLRCLAAGGVAVFQLPTYMPGYSFRVQDYLHALRAGGHRGMEMHMLPQRRVFELVQEAGCLPCEVFADDAAGPVYTSHTFVVRRPAP